MNTIYPTDNFTQQAGTFKEVVAAVKRAYPDARPDYQSTDDFIGYDYWSGDTYVAMMFCHYPGQWVCIRRNDP